MGMTLEKKGLPLPIDENRNSGRAVIKERWMADQSTGVSGPEKRKRARAATFRQADLVRAIKAAKRGGLDVGRVEIDPVTGHIVLLAHRAEIKAAKDDLGVWIDQNAGFQER